VRCIPRLYQPCTPIISRLYPYLYQHCITLLYQIYTPIYTNFVPLLYPNFLPLFISTLYPYCTKYIPLFIPTFLALLHQVYTLISTNLLSPYYTKYIPLFIPSPITPSIYPYFYQPCSHIIPIFRAKVWKMVDFLLLKVETNCKNWVWKENLVRLLLNKIIFWLGFRVLECYKLIATTL
jgi:hypothetical protein